MIILRMYTSVHTPLYVYICIHINAHAHQCISKAASHMTNA